MWTLLLRQDPRVGPHRHYRFLCARSPVVICSIRKTEVQRRSHWWSKTHWIWFK